MTNTFCSRVIAAEPRLRPHHQIDIAIAAEQCLSSLTWDERKDFAFLESVMPPFDQCIFAYRAGGKGRLRIGESGVICGADTDCMTMLERINFSGQDASLYDDCPELIAAKHVLRFQAYVCTADGNGADLTDTCLMFLDSEGQLIRRPGITFATMVFAQSNNNFEMSGVLANVVLPVLFACSLLHIRNVSLETVPLPPLPRNRERARMERRRRYRAGEVEHHTIVIRDRKGNRVDSFASQRHTLEGNGHRRLAFTRGHFRHYVPERPLLGKPGLFGTFWIPAFLSGSVENGVVTADYKMERAA